jgi:hypothetical protein
MRVSSQVSRVDEFLNAEDFAKRFQDVGIEIVPGVMPAAIPETGHPAPLRTHQTAFERPK